MNPAPANLDAFLALAPARMFYRRDCLDVFAGCVRHYFPFHSQYRRARRVFQPLRIDDQAKASESRFMSMTKTLIQPYLFFGGRCDEALQFYRETLGAEVLMLSRFKDSPEPSMAEPGMEEKVMHASFRIGETTLMASDGRCEGETKFEGFSLSPAVGDEAEASRLFAALAEGGEVTMPLEETFWSPKFGMLTDRFGVGWMVSVAQDAAMAE
jgi:PhnB protein